MSGKIKNVIDKIIEKRAGGDAFLISATKARLILKGINPENFDEDSPDDPVIIERLKDFSINLGITI